MKRLRLTWQDRALQQYEHQIAWIAAESVCRSDSEARTRDSPQSASAEQAQDS